MPLLRTLWVGVLYPSNIRIECVLEAFSSEARAHSYLWGGPHCEYMGRAPFTKWKGASSASERSMADVQYPNATIRASALHILVLPYLSLIVFSPSTIHAGSQTKLSSARVQGP